MKKSLLSQSCIGETINGQVEAISMKEFLFK